MPRRRNVREREKKKDPKTPAQKRAGIASCEVRKRGKNKSQCTRREGGRERRQSRQATEKSNSRKLQKRVTEKRVRGGEGRSKVDETASTNTHAL